MFRVCPPKGWTHVSESDEDLYNLFFRSSSDALCYENNWGFISQEARNGAIKYHGDGILLTGVVRHESSEFLFLFPPVGPNQRIDDLCKLVRDLAAETSRRIVLRKLPQTLFDALIGTQLFRHLPATTFTHPRDLPEDIYPQVILDVKLSRLGRSRRSVKTRNQLTYFNRNSPTVQDLRIDDVRNVIILIDSWNDQYRGRTKMTVDGSAYAVFANAFAGRIDKSTYFSKVLYVGPDAVGFTLAGRISPNAAALYSSISLTSFRGAAEYLLMALLDDLAAADIATLNMGGSETDGLFRFKNKFCTKELRYCYDAEYIAPRMGER